MKEKQYYTAEQEGAKASIQIQCNSHTGEISALLIH